MGAKVLRADEGDCEVNYLDELKFFGRVRIHQCIDEYVLACEATNNLV